MDHTSVNVYDPDGLSQCVSVMREQLEMQREMLQKQLEMQKQQMMDHLELQRTQMNQQLQQQAIHFENQLQLLGVHIPKERAPMPPIIPEDKGNGFKVLSSSQAQPQLPRHDQDQIVEKVPAAAAAAAEPAPPAAAEKGTKAALENFVRCHGLSTVSNWVQNYRKHPAGWGALLMIHGIPEVTNRLRQKVQNYAVFAALFLAGSMKAMSGKIPIHCPDDPDTIGCEIRKRVYTYSFSITIASHILTILLAMAFHNALNEAARDCDVYRMFAKGKGFRATMKCQMAFRVGAAFACIGVTAVAQESIGWEMVVWAAVLAGIVIYIFKRTEQLLFTTATICDYWREDTGGKPDANDPYDLTVPLECFQKKVENSLQINAQDAIATAVSGMGVQKAVVASSM
eukprot:TRINITY_DN16907_c0_g2_i1.p1 TRINITY_DN16907_c0_g2~~TRINITY_DN16907_c0_g2_i1.p1  ORF type:complete len:398 (-),score=92.37 TRINITY_DN16907_c0_g2_i1:80-1273(-)